MMDTLPDVAQMVERQFWELDAEGSIPFIRICPTGWALRFRCAVSAKE